MQRLNVAAFGFACGVSWAIFTLFLGWVALFGWGTPIVDALASIYPGYGADLAGAIAGAFWSLIDGFVGGAIVALVYNAFVRSK